MYKQKLGVDHTADYSPPDDFGAVLAEAELPKNELRHANAGGMPVVLVRRASLFTPSPEAGCGFVLLPPCQYDAAGSRVHVNSAPIDRDAPSNCWIR